MSARVFATLLAGGGVLAFVGAGVLLLAPTAGLVVMAGSVLSIVAAVAVAISQESEGRSRLRRRPPVTDEPTPPAVVEVDETVGPKAAEVQFEVLAGDGGSAAVLIVVAVFVVVAALMPVLNALSAAVLR